MCLYSIFRNHYGDTLYSKMTSEFDPEGVAALSNRLGMCLVTSVLTSLLLRAADCRPTLRSRLE